MSTPSKSHAVEHHSEAVRPTLRSLPHKTDLMWLPSNAELGVHQEPGGLIHTHTGPCSMLYHGAPYHSPLKVQAYSYLKNVDEILKSDHCFGLHPFFLSSKMRKYRSASQKHQNFR